jgi:predicted aminopeptidase
MKKILILFIILVTTFTFTACSPGYVLRGAWEEMKILNRRQKIDTILSEKKFSESERSKLELVMAAREFAARKGLNVGNSYSQYATVDSSALVWVLTAAPKFKMEPMLWWYPIVGSMPYKGFFSKDDAAALKNELEADGYDVFVRSSSAFSTLGWFNDPVLSTMMQGDEISLIDTILHEILHRTLWIPGSVDFNESLANFIGGQLAKEFFVERSDLVKVSLADARQQEEFEFSSFILELSDELEALYKSEASDMEQKKTEILERGRARWNGRPKSEANAYSLEKFPLSNASILGLRTYLRGLRDFDGMYGKCDRDFPKFLEKLKDFKSSNTDEMFRAINLTEVK